MVDLLNKGGVHHNCIICSIHSAEENDGTLMQIPFGEIESIEPNEHGNGYYIKANNIHYQVTDYLISGDPKMFRLVTYEDFYLNTIGTFVECDIPETEPNYISVPTKETDTPSKYWYGEDEVGKYIIRSANHWCNYYVGSDFSWKQQNNIKKCKWHLKMEKALDIISTEKMVYATLTGKVYLKHLRHRK